MDICCRRDELDIAKSCGVGYIAANIKGCERERERERENSDCQGLRRDYGLGITVDVSMFS